MKKTSENAQTNNKQAKKAMYAVFVYIGTKTRFCTNLSENALSYTYKDGGVNEGIFHRV